MATVALLLYLLFLALAVERARPVTGPPPLVDRALRLAARTYGTPYNELRAVSWCESRWNPRAVGSGSYGLFQFLPSTFAHTPYAGRSIFDPVANSLAAGWLWLHDNRSWREWTCRPG